MMKLKDCIVLVVAAFYAASAFVFYCLNLPVDPTLDTVFTKAFFAKTLFSSLPFLVKFSWFFFDQTLRAFYHWCTS
jgi:hypothetical protein